MQIRVGYELNYEFPQPTPMILTLNVHYSRVSDLARGRDAADVAIATTFGPNTLQSFRVWTDEVTA